MHVVETLFIWRINLSILFWLFSYFNYLNYQSTEGKNYIQRQFLSSINCNIWLYTFFGLPLIIFLWRFSIYWFIVDCWVVCSHWLDTCSLTLKYFLGCVSNLYVDSIQTGHSDLLPPQSWGGSWQGFRFDVHTC